MPITNAVVPSGTPFTDLTARESLVGDYLFVLSEQDISILNHSALAAWTAPVGSKTARVPVVGLGGYDLLASTTPGSEVTATTLSSSYVDVTLATKAKRYATDDLARYAMGQSFNTALLAQDCAISVGKTLISMVANVTDDFTSTVGSTGVVLTWDDISDAKAKLRNAGASGTMVGLLHPYQWAQLEKDASAAGFTIAISLTGVLNAGLGAYVGSYMGIDFYVSTLVPTANAGVDRAGAIFCRGGVVWADAQMADDGDPNIIGLGRATLERVRQGEYQATSWMMAYNVGVSKGLDGAGVTVISKNALA